MKHPSEDIDNRAVIWDSMQFFWMDTDIEAEISDIASVCARSKYALEELEQIYWNEVRPAVSFNLRLSSAPEWRGFEIENLKRLVLGKSRYGRPLPCKWLHPYAAKWWGRLAHEIFRQREGTVASE